MMLIDRNPLERSRPASCLNATLHCLELLSPDAPALAEFYRRALGFRVHTDGDPLVARGPDRTLIFSQGSARTLGSAGYSLPDAQELDRLRHRVRNAEWPFQDIEDAIFVDGIAVRDPDGTLFTFGLPRDDAVVSDASQARPARLQHLVMASRDPDNIVRFFIDVLGFTLSDNVVDDEGGVRTTFLRCSHEHHSFAIFKAPEDRLDHHCYETTDWNMMRDWCDHMATNHVPIKWGPGRHGPGNNVFIFIHDPDGNWVELSAELEIVSHERPAGIWPHEERTLNSWGQAHLRS